MTKQSVRLAVAMLMMGSTLGSFSKTITVDQALEIATEFVNSAYDKANGNAQLKAVLTAGSPWKPTYYIFNGVDNGCFVIISAEDTTTPVLGYSFDSSYPVDNAPEAMTWMMEGVEREIEAAPSVQSSQTDTQLRLQARTTARTQSKAEEKILATAAWSQEAPFNSMIPGRPLVGCVGTAMATIMKYHAWPQNGTGMRDDVDFNVAYDWNSMRDDNYRNGFSQTEADAVAQLMYHASKSIDTQYAMSGSSAYEVRVPAALSTYFGYDPGVSYKKRAEVASQDDWDSIVKDEIDAGRPVLYCGQDVTAGHAFVCDGYQGEYLHFNWGWGGSANGFFRSTALNPTVSKTHHYNNLNTIIYNIKPADGAIKTWSSIHITADGNQTGIGSDLTDLASGKSFIVRVGNLKNLSYDDFKGKIAVALCGEDGAMKSLLSAPSPFSLVSMGTLYNGYVDFSNCVLPSGTKINDNDRVRIMTMADGSDTWLPVAGELPTINELNTKISEPASFSISLPSGIDGVTVTGKNSVIRGWNYQFSVVLSNPAENVVTVKANGITLAPGAENTYTITNVLENQNIAVLVQKAADVKEKRSFWVGSPGTLSTIIPEEETGTIKELTLFGSIDSRDFTFIRNAMRLTKLDISGVYIAAHGSDQANAIPREAFRGIGSLNEVILPSSVNRLNNGCFRQCGITTITIPAGVKTYEYNVFCGASRLRDIYVGREAAEFINWCVLSGVRVQEVTLHVPNDKAFANYNKAENWNTIANIIVDPIPAKTDAMWAVMENNDVMFESSVPTGNITPGTEISFTASHIADNDCRMEVYANNTLLTPAATGQYTTAINGNTIIHFELIAPTAIDTNKSVWTLTAANGSIGMLTDAVNVINGEEFTVRLNALKIPTGYDQLFWAIALTDAESNIKEFISPVTLWTGGAGDGMKMNVNCCVKDSKVREGNLLRLVTSGNKRVWNVVKGADESITDFLPALNNMCEIYSVNIPEVADATITGAVTQAVRGRDITLKVVPNSASKRIDMSINGKQVVKEAASVSYTFVVMEDTDVNIDVYDPREMGSVTYSVSSGELYKSVTSETVRPHVIVVGETYASDLKNAFTQLFAQSTIRRLDLSGLKIIADPTNGDNVANMLPSEMFYKSSGIGQKIPALEEVILPSEVIRIADAAFKNCANIKEITLPDSLTSQRIEIGKYASGGIKYAFGLGNRVFDGCDALTTIRIPGAPSEYKGRKVVAHHCPFGLDYYNIMGSDMQRPKTVTVIVPEEYLSIYKTPYDDNYYGNVWLSHGYNILSEYPVYGINFDPTRLKVTDENFDVDKAASFLGQNVTLESIRVEGKIALVNPSVACRIYDNGNLVKPDADGTVPVEFFNPANGNEGVGNHTLTVINMYDLTFSTSSPLFSISNTEVYNKDGHNFHSYDATDSLAPVLRDIPENSSVRFKIAYNGNHNESLQTLVMDGVAELMPDDDGFYSLDITNNSIRLEISALTDNGAVLDRDDLAAINPSESQAITEITIAGNMNAEEFAQAMECFPALESIDLTGYTGELPDGAFKGMTTLSTVALPEIESIPAGMFSGCTSLEAVDIPVTVNAIGEGAFKDCLSLNSVTLTGITGIGAGAFEGCDNLTTITLLAGSSTGEPSATATARAHRAPSVNTISPDAFTGLNPNCIIVLDEGVKVPEAAANYISTSVGTVTETLPDGTETERTGRMYSASTPIVLKHGYPLAIPFDFTLTGEATITYEAEAEGWAGVVVPFDVEKFAVDGKEIEISLFDGEIKGKDHYMIYTLSGENNELAGVNTLKAHTPALFHSPAAEKIQFIATSGTIAANPESVTAEGPEFSLNACYSAATLTANETYLLDNDGYAFTPVETEEETITLAPLTVYATSPVTVSEIVVDMTGATSGIESVTAEIEGLTISREGNALVIYTDSDMTQTIYTVDGRIIRIVELSTGRNEVTDLAPGLYILAGHKIRF